MTTNTIARLGIVAAAMEDLQAADPRIARAASEVHAQYGRTRWAGHTPQPDALIGLAIQLVQAAGQADPAVSHVLEPALVQLMHVEAAITERVI